MDLLEKCPVCTGKWIKKEKSSSQYQCIYCANNYYCSGGFWSFKRKNVILTGDELYWYSTGECVYYPKHNDNISSAIKFPWLSFDITPTALKTLITFL